MVVNRADVVESGTDEELSGPDVVVRSANVVL